MIDDFDEYNRQGEPSQIEKSKIWQTAIGLQQVDGLTPSAYLIETAKENIEGKITIHEVKYRISTPSLIGDGVISSVARNLISKNVRHSAQSEETKTYFSHW